MKKLTQFSVEKHSDNCIWLRSEKEPEKIIFSIQEKEIMIGNGKGVIPIKNIQKLKSEPYIDDKIKISIYVRENSKWNENQKKKHPLLWKFGLATKSRAKTIIIGVTKSNKKSEMLFQFLEKRGVDVEKI